MKILGLMTFLMGLYLQTFRVFAVELDSVELLEVSSSKNTIVVDRGLLEDYTKNSYAQFFIQSGDYKDPKIFLVAEGKLVKSFPKKSIWFMSMIFASDFIKANEKLLILTSNQVKAGRQIKLSQRHVVLSPNEYISSEQYLEKNKNSVPDRLIKEKDNNEKFSELYESKNELTSDVQIQSYEYNKTKSGLQFSDQYNDEIKEKYFIGNQVVKLGDIKNGEDKKLLDSMASGLLKKINSEKFGYYKTISKRSEKRDEHLKTTITSVYDKAIEDKKNDELLNPMTVAKIKRNGVNWSEDMDDETLRRYFIQSGIEQEISRREMILKEADGHEVMFNYSGSTKDHSTPDDENFRSMGHTFGLGYELHLYRTSKDLIDWSLQFLLETGVANYDVGGLNAHGSEYYYGTYLNYYFFNNPLTLNSFIFSGGIGLKVGSVEMSNPNLTKNYSYQVLTLPAFQLMVKYRLRVGELTDDSGNSGISFNTGMNLDSKKLSLSESIDSPDQNLNGKISISDIKYLIGMSIYF